MIRPKRVDLSALHKSTFLQDATRQVLKKHLALPSTKSTDQLEDLTNLEYQLTTLCDHMFVFDIDDCCMTILRPVSSQVSSDLQDGTWNLFEDYASLDPAVVANHLVYSHNWLNAAPYIRDNISYVYLGWEFRRKSGRNSGFRILPAEFAGMTYVPELQVLRQYNMVLRTMLALQRLLNESPPEFCGIPYSVPARPLEVRRNLSGIHYQDVYMFLKNNTDEVLWNLCQSDYVQYPEWMWWSFI
jgi:hypothetical protein